MFDTVDVHCTVEMQGVLCHLKGLSIYMIIHLSMNIVMAMHDIILRFPTVSTQHRVLVCPMFTFQDGSYWTYYTNWRRSFHMLHSETCRWKLEYHHTCWTQFSFVEKPICITVYLFVNISHADVWWSFNKCMILTMGPNHRWTFSPCTSKFRLKM